MVRQGAQQLPLGPVAGEFYRDLRLAPLLRTLLFRSGALVGAVAGSISIVEQSSGTYTKLAEVGASCRLGQRFPLDEGITGQVYSQRRPVVLDTYRDIRAGHLRTDSAAAAGSVAAVPIWWRAEVIGVNVLFAGRPHVFSGDEIDDLEMLTQLAAPGIVRAGGSDPLLSRLLEDRSPAVRTTGVSTVVTEVGARPVPAAVAELALELVTLAERAAVRGRTPAVLHVALVHQPEGLRLLVQDEHSSSAPTTNELLSGPHLMHWQELLGRTGGALQVQDVPGWGTLLTAVLPYSAPRPAAALDSSPALAAAPRLSGLAGPAAGEGAAGATPSTPIFTPRERQVLELLGKGMSDRAIARSLVLSPKTVEKYVGAVIRQDRGHEPEPVLSWSRSTTGG